MNLFRTVRSGLSTTVVLAVLLVSLASCGGESEPEPAPDVDLGALLSSTGENLAAMSTITFNMVDEMESGAKFFGTTFKSLEAEVEAPDSFKMVVDVEAPGFGFVEIEMMAVGEEAFLKLSKDAPWNALPLDQVPFNFAGLGFTLRDLLDNIQDEATVAGRESIQNTETILVEAELTSDELQSLITSADPGLEVALTLWISEAEQTLQQIRIAGQVYIDDDPETVRLLSITSIDVPVDIQIPDLGSGS
ncbi:MAG: LppX_LprAFG lipoprotein [Actinomycetia bacterium]|nr:LppX_LprAFG lipoprotein [Actinomycetes bacterium]